MAGWAWHFVVGALIIYYLFIYHHLADKTHPLVYVLVKFKARLRIKVAFSHWTGQRFAENATL